MLGLAPMADITSVTTHCQELRIALGTWFGKSRPADSKVDPHSFIRELKVEVTNWCKNDQLVVLNCELVFFKMTNW